MNSIINLNIKLISLVGMMGSGKTCGSVLAKIIGMSFVDIDSIIESEEDLKISRFLTVWRRIFSSKRREDYFDKINEYFGKNIKAVISLGGGGFERKNQSFF